MRYLKVFILDSYSWRVPQKYKTPKSQIYIYIDSVKLKSYSKFIWNMYISLLNLKGGIFPALLSFHWPYRLIQYSRNGENYEDFSQITREIILLIRRLWQLLKMLFFNIFVRHCDVFIFELFLNFLAIICHKNKYIIPIIMETMNIFLK